MKNTLFFALLIGFCVFWSCRKEEVFTTDAAAKLTFSQDTMRFDTVFAQLGSATRTLKVFNRNNKAIRISKISIPTGAKSFFRLNIDGKPTQSIENVEIAANDSIYIFGEVTIDPNKQLSDSPFVVNDEISFETNTNKQRVVLEAWGQNAIYLPNRFFRGKRGLIQNEDITLDDKKPYVVYGQLYFANNTVTIAAGTRIYVHGGLGKDKNGFYPDGALVFLKGSRLKIKGTAQKPVTIQGDRLEKEFQDVSGQWAALYFTAGSTGNEIDYTLIQNARLGIGVDSAADLRVRNTSIMNAQGTALSASYARVEADNCLFYTDGRESNSVSLGFGGIYTFRYCTIVSYGNVGESLAMSNYRCYDGLACKNLKVNALTATFKNSIIYGSGKDEITLGDASGGKQPDLFTYNFDNCIVRVGDLLKPTAFPNFLNNCKNCLQPASKDRVFKDTDKNNYELDSLSVAYKKALPIQNLTIDLLGKTRKVMPDIGCYERK
jgi:hypothetical protein